MEEGPIVSSLLLFTLPVLCSQLLQQLYNIADCVIVGRFCGSFALAATGISGLILSVMINFFIGFSTGIGIITAHQFGAYEYSALKKTIITSSRFGAVTGIAIGAFILLSSTALLRLIACPSDTMSSANTYLVICSIGIAPQLLYNIFNAILRSLGDTRSSLIYLLTSSGLNLILDLLFVLVFGLGLAGAAAATVLSQWFLLVLMIRRMLQLDPAYRPTLRGEGMSRSDFLHMVRLSLPSGMQAIFMSISSLIVQVSINSFGYAAAAGITLYAKLEGFLYFPTFSYGIALTGFIGQNIGAGRPDRVRKAVRFSVIASAAVILPLSLILVWISPGFLRLFTTDNAILVNASEAILYNFPFYFLYAVNQVYLGALKGRGKTTYPMICTLVCYCVFRVLWSHYLIPVFHSMIVVYTGYDVSWVIMIAMLLPVYYNTERSEASEPPQAEPPKLYLCPLCEGDLRCPYAKQCAADQKCCTLHAEKHECPMSERKIGLHAC